MLIRAKNIRRISIHTDNRRTTSKENSPHTTSMLGRPHRNHPSLGPRRILRSQDNRVARVHLPNHTRIGGQVLRPKGRITRGLFHLENGIPATLRVIIVDLFHPICPIFLTKSRHIPIIVPGSSHFLLVVTRSNGALLVTLFIVIQPLPRDRLLITIKLRLPTFTQGPIQCSIRTQYMKEDLSTRPYHNLFPAMLNT